MYFLRLFCCCYFFFPSWLCCPLRFQNSPQTHLWEHFLLCGNFASFMSPSPGWVSIPKSFVSVFVFYILSYFVLKRMGCLLGAWCSLPVFKSCFVEIAQYSNDPLMNLLEKTPGLPHPILLLSWTISSHSYSVFAFLRAFFFFFLLHFWRII